MGEAEIGEQYHPRPPRQPPIRSLAQPPGAIARIGHGQQPTRDRWPEQHMRPAAQEQGEGGQDGGGDQVGQGVFHNRCSDMI